MTQFMDINSSPLNHAIRLHENLANAEISNSFGHSDDEASYRRQEGNDSSSYSS